MQYLGDIINWVLTAIPTITSVYLYRRMRRGEVASQEIRNTLDHIDSADRMVDLVEKANDLAAEKHRERYESIIKEITEKYERILTEALLQIKLCPHQLECTVYSMLRTTAHSGPDKSGDNRHDSHCRDPA